MKLTLAHSPDSDDAFMFYALAKNKVDSNGIEFEHHLHDIETLNRLAEQETYDITALSTHGWFYVQDKYTVLDCGSAVGTGYGPVVVSPDPIDAKDLVGRKIGVPGLRTSAFLLLKLYIKNPLFEVIKFDEIIPAIQQGKVQAGLLIHEGQLTHPEYRLNKVIDLGAWWYDETGLPIVLGVLGCKKSLDTRLVNEVIASSIKYGIEHFDEVLDYSLQYGRGVSRKKGREFVSMYVNAETIMLSPKSRESIKVMEQAFKSGSI